MGSKSASDKDPPTCLSFFSGALGLDLGLEQAGFRHIGFNEIKKVACQTIRENRPNAKVWQADIRDLSSGDLRSLCGNSAPFLICGGPPCQAFSTAGRRLGLHDDRGNIFLKFLDFICELEPRYVVIENVRGLLSCPMMHRPHAYRGSGFPPLQRDEQPGGALSFLLSQLENAGYQVSFNLYDAAFFGVPQHRERVVLIASKNGKVPLMHPSHGDEQHPFVTFREATRDITHHDVLPFRKGREEFFRLVSEGQNWRSLPSDLRPLALGGAYQSTGGRVGFCRRLAWDEPSPTLVTSPDMPATELGHPTELRPISVQEYARLQTFPDEWKFAGTLAQKYRQIGNAVPVEFARQIGVHVLAHDRGELPLREPMKVSRYRDTSDQAWRIKYGYTSSITTAVP